jgi:hypothetical protein
MANVSDEAKEQYRKMLSEYRLQRLQDPIANCYPWQTRLATLELLEMAKRDSSEVRILTGTATEDFYCNEVTNRLEECLVEDCVVKVMVWNESERLAGRTLRNLHDRHPGLFQLEYAGTRNRGAEIPHFLLVDESAYRVEHPHEYFENVKMSDTSPETKARICFNDVASGKVLKHFFDQLWESRIAAQALSSAAEI